MERDEQTTEMARLHVEECLTYGEIAERYGVSRQAVHQRLRRAGVKSQSIQSRKQMRVVALELAHANVMSGLSTLAQEAERLGYANGESLRRVLRTAGMVVHVGQPEPEHGTTARYLRGCKCWLCRQAHSDRQRKLIGKKPPTHGESGYRNYGCRCRICKEAHRLHGREQRRRRKERARAHA